MRCFARLRAAGASYWLGAPTLETIIANTVWPGFLDRYLARKAVAGQQTDKLVQVDRRDNLGQPVTRLRRTRGSFSDEAGLQAILIPAPLVRIGVVAAGTLAFLTLGLALRGAAGRRR